MFLGSIKGHAYGMESRKGKKQDRKPAVVTELKRKEVSEEVKGTVNLNFRNIFYD